MCPAGFFNSSNPSLVRTLSLYDFFLNLCSYFRKKKIKGILLKFEFHLCNLLPVNCQFLHYHFTVGQELVGLDLASLTMNKNNCQLKNNISL